MEECLTLNQRVPSSSLGSSALRDRAAVARNAHNVEVEGSNPPPATGVTIE